jgi:hypothetical protein
MRDRAPLLLQVLWQKFGGMISLSDFGETSILNII